MEKSVLVLTFILVLCLVIVIHEAGHLIVAKMSGAKIKEFGIFFPPRIATLFEWKGTKFTLNSLPLGGFVAPEIDEETKISTIDALPPVKKIATYGAGVFFNVMTAAILLFVIYSLSGVPDESRIIVSDMKVDGAAHQAGIQLGDEILGVNNIKTDGAEKLNQVLGLLADEEVVVTVIRDDQTIDILPVTVGTDGTIGVLLTSPYRKANLGEVATASWQGVVDGVAPLYRVVAGIFTPKTAGNISTPTGDGQTVELIGFTGMYQYFQTIVRESGSVWGGVMIFIIILSLSLAAVNTLPFPGLDGWKILTTIPELFRIRIPDAIQNGIQMAGLGFLLLFAVWLNLKEIFVR